MFLSHRPRPGCRSWFGLLALAALFAGCAPQATSTRDLLWQIVAECLDPSAPNYCSTCIKPMIGTCGGDRPCPRITDVWGETTDYVAMRDMKMCECPPEFVHGLAMPRFRVTGVEDSRRPAGIWAFAWDVARSRIADEQQIALVVNPPGARSQDQLHLHLVRLMPGARGRLAFLAPALTARLDEVWDMASRHAGSAKDYGVLVARDDAGSRFLVLTQTRNLEDEFTAAVCR